ncbi:MAG: lamin tail domain-containing protein, partial [Candidatus Thorarchaeota archaeon]
SDTNFEWDTKLETNGVHNIVCRARDNSSNWGEDSISVVIDNVVDNNIPLLNFTGTIKVMTYNIEESGANPDWMNVVKEENPDIMILVEVGTWDDSSDLVLRNSIEELNNYFVDEAPYSGEVTQGISYSTSGEAILSRFSILDFNQIGIVPLDNGTNYDVTHDFIHATVNVNGTNVHLVGAHLKAMGGETNEDRREWETEGIINYMDNLGEVPVMYMGDLNSFSPYDTGDLAPNGDLGYGPLTMMLDPDDPTYGQYASEIHNFTDVFRTLNPTNPGYTYGHQNPTYTSRIDFLLVNDYFLDKLINSTCGDTAHADTGSDHYSVDIFLGWNSTGINDTIAPADVTGLKVDANYTMGIDLSWNANNETDLYRYVVYRDSVQIAEVAESYYNDTGLSSNTTYTYEVSAKDLYGNEGNKSLAVNATTLDMSSLESIVINEFLPDAFTIYTEEWIELFNPSAEAVDLAGYILDDLVAGGGSPFTIPGGSIIATGGFLVFNQSTVGFALNNDGDTVNLIKPDGVTVQDSYTYDSSSDDVSYGRQVDGGVVWTTFVNPTPGASNLGGTLYRVVIPPSTGYLFEMFYIVKLW